MVSNKKTTPTIKGSAKPVGINIKRVAIGVTLAVVALLSLNYVTGIGSYAYMYARCGHQPVVASRFAAGNEYILPSQSGYGPNMFSEYYCTEAEANAAGFHAAP